MYPHIVIYNSFCVQSYGLMIVSGIMVALILAFKNNYCQKSGLLDHSIPILYWITIGALFGGRILYCFMEHSWQEWYAIWQGGFCILGALIGGWIAIHAYVSLKKLPLLVVLDCVALYIPLVQSFARIGCFLTGCCGGSSLNLPPLLHNWFGFGIVHPTPLYSALSLLAIFFGLHWYATHYQPKIGTIAALYSFLVLFERFANDFLRADRSLIWSQFSLQQAIAFVCIVMLALYWTIVFTSAKRALSS